MLSGLPSEEKLSKHTPTAGKTEDWGTQTSDGAGAGAGAGASPRIPAITLDTAQRKGRIFAKMERRNEEEEEEETIEEMRQQERTPRKGKVGGVSA